MLPFDDVIMAYATKKVGVRNGIRLWKSNKMFVDGRIKELPNHTGRFSSLIIIL